MAKAAANVGSGIPVKLLEESIGHMVVVELDRGIIVRGRLMSVETCMNLVLEDVVMKDTTEVRRFPEIIIRGNLILYVIIPGKMKYSPLLQKVNDIVAQRAEHFKLKN